MKQEETINTQETRVLEDNELEQVAGGLSPTVTEEGDGDRRNDEDNHNPPERFS